jgi:hypothetical protein
MLLKKVARVRGQLHEAAEPHDEHDQRRYDEPPALSYEPLELVGAFKTLPVMGGRLRQPGGAGSPGG